MRHRVVSTFLAVAVLAPALLAACGGSTPVVTASTPPVDVAKLTVRVAWDFPPTPATLHIGPWLRADGDGDVYPPNVVTLYRVLNEEPDRYGATHLPRCPLAAERAPAGYGLMYHYAFTFSWHDFPVERVLVSVRCGGIGIRRSVGSVPLFGPEVGTGPDMAVFFRLAPYPRGISLGKLDPHPCTSLVCAPPSPGTTPQWGVGMS